MIVLASQQLAGTPQCERVGGVDDPPALSWPPLSLLLLVTIPVPDILRYVSGRVNFYIHSAHAIRYSTGLLGAEY